jgi:hypothetical protein
LQLIKKELLKRCGEGLHTERYRDENEQISYGRWQADNAGGSGEAVVRSNEK